MIKDPGNEVDLNYYSLGCSPCCDLCSPNDFMSPSSNLHNTNFYYLWNEKRYGRKVNTTIPHFARLSKKIPSSIPNFETHGVLLFIQSSKSQSRWRFESCDVQLSRTY